MELSPFEIKNTELVYNAPEQATQEDLLGHSALFHHACKISYFAYIGVDLLFYGKHPEFLMSGEE